MAWCPVCKNEYRPGIKVCADCGAELVDTLETNELETLIYGDQELLLKIKSFLEANGIKYVLVEYSQQKDSYQLQVPHDNVEKTVGMVQFFMQQQMEENQRRMQEAAQSGELSPEQMEAFKAQQEAMKKGAVKRKPPKAYESSAKKAEENRASAWALLLIGFVTLALIVCSLTGVFPVAKFFNGSYMFLGVMGALSAVFIIFGFISLKSAKSLDADAATENSLKESLITWSKENLRGQDIDHYIRMRTPEIDDDTMFFPRMELIKARINHQFLNLDQAFLEQLVDEEIYGLLYPEEGEQT